jgi:hypothetical protein
MQAQTLNGSAAEATMNTIVFGFAAKLTGSLMPKQTAPRQRPTMASHRLDLPSTCEISGRARITRTHQTCSRTRQRRKEDEWAELMADKVAARLARGRRYSW